MELRLNLPAVAAGDRVFMNVTEVFFHNVSSSLWLSVCVYVWDREK
jgi:hypothetical protein